MVLDEDTQAQLAQLRQERGLHIRRLGKLKEQNARLGGETPPAVEMEIEDIQGTIDQIGGRISALQAAALIQEKRRILIGDTPLDPAVKELWNYVFALEDNIHRQFKTLFQANQDNDAARAAGQQNNRRWVYVAIVLLIVITIRVLLL